MNNMPRRLSRTRLDDLFTTLLQVAGDPGNFPTADEEYAILEKPSPENPNGTHIFWHQDHAEDPNTAVLDIKISGEEELNAFWGCRFKFLEQLQIYAERAFSENTNSDACSFNYSIDTDHLSYQRIILTVSVRDYLA